MKADIGLQRLDRGISRSAEIFWNPICGDVSWKVWLHSGFEQKSTSDSGWRTERPSDRSNLSVPRLLGSKLQTVVLLNYKSPADGRRRLEDPVFGY